MFGNVTERVLPVELFRNTLVILHSFVIRHSCFVISSQFFPMPQPVSLSALNTASSSDFLRLIGPVFEHSPWIAEATWPKRPFGSLKELHARLCDTVRQSTSEEQIALIRAHPDLVGHAALAGALTHASASEQASAGLARLTPEEIAAFQSFNEQYRRKFDFPFVFCARLNKKAAVLDAFPKRLNHSREQEVHTALEEIYKIAYLRLADIVSEHVG
jgi:2-oxo-4-hydroxy-4-carboxy-5-ureidoimidazoline decarboxylase